MAIPLACQRAGINISEIDFFEINEAFSVVAEANCRILKLPKERVNIWGGAVSLGHPLGFFFLMLVQLTIRTISFLTNFSIFFKT